MTDDVIIHRDPADVWGDIEQAYHDRAYSLALLDLTRRARDRRLRRLTEAEEALVRAAKRADRERTKFLKAVGLVEQAMRLCNATEHLRTETTTITGQPTVHHPHHQHETR